MLDISTSHVKSDISPESSQPTSPQPSTQSQTQLPITQTLPSKYLIKCWSKFK